MIIPGYPFLESKIENHKAVFPKEWDQLMAAFKGAHIFKQFVPIEYGGQKTSELDIYCLMELLGYASPGIRHYLTVSHSRAIDIVSAGEIKPKRRNTSPEWLMGI